MVASLPFSRAVVQFLREQAGDLLGLGHFVSVLRTKRSFKVSGKAYLWTGQVLVGICRSTPTSGCTCFHFPDLNFAFWISSCLLSLQNLRGESWHLLIALEKLICLELFRCLIFFFLCSSVSTLFPGRFFPRMAELNWCTKSINYMLQ